MVVTVDGVGGLAAIFDLLNKWLNCPASRCMKSLDMSGVMLYNTLQGGLTGLCLCVVQLSTFYFSLECVCEFFCVCVTGCTYLKYFFAKGTERL